MAHPELVPIEDRPTVLIAAGLDPSGGAGLTVDAAVARAFGIHPLAAQTGVAVQNTGRFDARRDLGGDLLRRQLDVLTEEFLVGAVKTGMMGTAEQVEALADWLAERPRLPLVVDPVLRSTSGGELADPKAADALARRFLPRARVLTPNLDEARLLSGRSITRKDDVPGAARALLDLGPEWVVIKGGHLPRARALDYVAGSGAGFWLEEDRLENWEVRGTGCALATGIACGLARGQVVPESVRAAKAFVTRAIDESYVAGRGRFLRLFPRPAES